MKLHYGSFAPNPRRVRIYLTEKGITDVEIVKVDMVAEEHRTDEFRRDKNPLALLPVLELDDGQMLTESMAIIEYLEELYPDPPLIGRDPLQRARTREADRIADLGLMAGASLVWVNSSPFFAKRLEQKADVAAYGRDRVHDYFARIDGMLAERPWLAGDQFTVADITALCAIDFAHASKVDVDPERYPNIARWLEVIRQRPSCMIKRKKG